MRKYRGVGEIRTFSLQARISAALTPSWNMTMPNDSTMVWAAVDDYAERHLLSRADKTLDAALEEALVFLASTRPNPRSSMPASEREERTRDWHPRRI